MGTAASVRVLIVEDDTAMAEILAMALDLEPGLEWVGTATTVAAALEQATRSRPDVVLMDVQLPDGDGIAASTALVSALPSAAVIVLTAAPGADVLARAADAGAAGLLAKGTPLATLAAAVRLAADGGVPVTATDLAGLFAASRRAPPPVTTAEVFDDEDFALLRLLAQGDSTAVAADRLGVEPAALRRRVRSLAEAAGARSTLELLVAAARGGLLA